MRLPQVGNIVLYHDPYTDRWFAALMVDTEDVEYGKEVRVKLHIFTVEGSYAKPGWTSQGSEKGEWQWGDIPITIQTN